MRTLAGEVVLPGSAPAATGTVALIQVQDVSYEDAPAEVVAEERLEGLTCAPDACIPFRLRVPEAETGHTLILWIHVDVNGDHQVSPGDLLTISAHPVPLSGAAELEVVVAVI